MSATPPPPGTYRLDADRSTISFTTRHFFGLGKVTGTFALVSGEIVVAEPPSASSVTAAASAESFASANPTRDKAIKSRTYLDAEHHPRLGFRSADVRDTPDGWVLTGELTVRDNTAPIEFTVTDAAVDGSTVTVHAAGRADRYAHGLTAQKGMTGRYIDLELTAVADRV
jgi:polyisoprenoid-binding protein YceI